ncbi:pyridoxamine 5'-phosphate oxidase family protein [Streptomyces sp. NPDC005963]|uniref:helix-turn-helix domain-containing protein n=1 Tax=Streptomyces sp. NPDC005963 TaxID=3156721 RepID=UPI0034030DC3
MTSGTPPPEESGDPARSAPDLGRRVAARRRELGLSREELAERTGSVPGFVQYIEESAAAPGMGVLLRLADALSTTVPELTGASADRPPGGGSAGGGARLRELDPAECRSLLARAGVGRVAVTTHEGPAVVPVNYVMSGEEIVYRTMSGSVPAAAAGAEIAFEVDRIDDAFRTGWSVLAVGEGREITAPDQIRDLDARAADLAWAGGHRDLWIAVRPRRLTGRTIDNALRPPS